jgi:chlorophyll synthase
MWAFDCGIGSSGLSLASRGRIAIAGVVLAGPTAYAASEAVNDRCDRRGDTINEPSRPIPLWRLPGNRGFDIACGLAALSLLPASRLGARGFSPTVLGSAPYDRGIA